MHNGAYRLGKLDGAISHLHYAAFCIIPYHTCSQAVIPVTHIIDNEHMEALVNDDEEEHVDPGGSNLNPPGGVR
jgi:hypothetical protein